jgi:ectoine hydroxylase-related dioxygenase (phytanoyl-CoA dioxygenase family)
MNVPAISREFHERGFVIIENFFTAEQIDAIEAALKRYIDRVEEGSVAAHVVYEPCIERKIRNIFEMERDDEFFADLPRDTLLIELVTAIFNDEPISMGVELFGKPAKVGSEVPYHQDNAYFNLEPDQALTIWIALADATEENGCVRYISGSHRLGNLPHESSGVKGNSQRLRQLPDDAGPEISGMVRRGGALIHHCNTIHRSEPNNSDHDRPGLLLVYKAARCRIDRTRKENYDAVLTATQ